MIKKILPSITVMGIVLSILLGGCNRPKTIPDDKLDQIFKEIYLTNAYVQVYGVQADTLELYLPVFDKYGYTVDDLKYTVASFSRRKSSKFSDIIVRAKDQMETELKEYTEAVRILDFIDSIAAEHSSKIVYTKDSIRVYAIKDTANLRITVPVKEGRYKVKYSYLMDTLEQNRGIRSSHTMKDLDAVMTGHTNHWYERGRRSSHQLEMNASPKDVELIIHFANYPRKEMKKPALRIDSIQVIYYPTKEVALELLANEASSRFSSSILKDYGKVSQDSVALHHGVWRVDPKRDSVRRQ